MNRKIFCWPVWSIRLSFSGCGACVSLGSRILRIKARSIRGSHIRWARSIWRHGYSASFRQSIISAMPTGSPSGARRCFTMSATARSRTSSNRYFIFATKTSRSPPSKAQTRLSAKSCVNIRPIFRRVSLRSSAAISNQSRSRR